MLPKPRGLSQLLLPGQQNTEREKVIKCEKGKGGRHKDGWDAQLEFCLSKGKPSP